MPLGDVIELSNLLFVPPMTAHGPRWLFAMVSAAYQAKHSLQVLGVVMGFLTAITRGRQRGSCIFQGWLAASLVIHATCKARMFGGYFGMVTGTSHGFRHVWPGQLAGKKWCKRKAKDYHDPPARSSCSVPLCCKTPTYDVMKTVVLSQKHSWSHVSIEADAEHCRRSGAKGAAGI